MKRRALIGGLAAAAAATPAPAAGWKEAYAEGLLRDLLAHWQSEREYSLDIVGAMPADKFDWRPTPEVRTFAEQAIHFAGAQVSYLSRLELAPPPTAPKTTDKQAVVAWVEASYGYAREVLEKLGEREFLRRDVPLRSGALHTTFDLWLRGVVHTAHHRGQLIVYLRLNGLQPPDWRFAPQGGKGA